MAKAKKKGSKSKPHERRERHFVPQSTTSSSLVYLIGGAGSALLGAGAWGQFYRPTTEISAAFPYAWWLLAAGAALVGVAIWIGTSGEPALRVGDGGVGIDRGTVTRLPWHAISRIAFDGGAGALLVHGKDEHDGEHTLRVPLRSQPQAVAWIVKEASARVPAILELSESEIEQLPAAAKDAGELLTLDALQVVGKRCAVSDKVISYEPDARVCPRCERVYHRTEVPETCACGGSLASLRPLSATSPQEAAEA